MCWEAEATPCLNQAGKPPGTFAFIPIAVSTVHPLQKEECVHLEEGFCAQGLKEGRDWELQEAVMKTLKAQGWESMVSCREQWSLSHGKSICSHLQMKLSLKADPHLLFPA